MSSERAIHSVMCGIFAVACIGLVVFIMAARSAPASESKTDKPFFGKPILLGAHRGGAAVCPENTLTAFTNTAHRWKDILLETDARLTADGAVVLIHDATVDRTTDGTGKVAEKTLAELRKLDAGYRFSPDGGTTFPYRGKGVTVPTLAEVLAALPDSRFEIELKPEKEIAEATVRVIREAQAGDRVLLASFDPQEMRQARRLTPRAASCYELIGGMVMLGRLRDGTWNDYTPSDDVLSVSVEMMREYKLTQDEIRATQAKGIRFQVHTINDRDEMRAMLDLGVDSILTDRPDILADTIAEWQKTRQ